MAKTIDDALRAPLALALTKAKVTANRDEIEPGELHGTALVRVAWDLKVGPDYEQVIGHTIPWQKLLGLALSKLNGTTVDSLVREYIEAEEEGSLDDGKALKAAAAQALERIKGAAAPRQCSGKVTGDVVVTEVVAIAV